MEAFFEHLLVQARAVETGLHRQLDVALERCIGRRSPDAIRVKALVENQAQENRLVVEVNLPILNMHLAQPGIGFYVIEQRAFLIQHIQLQVIEERRLWRPGFGVAKLAGSAGFR